MWFLYSIIGGLFTRTLPFWLDWMKYLSFLHYAFPSLMWFLYCIIGGLFTRTLPFWLDWMKYLSFLHYAFPSLMWFLYSIIGGLFTRTLQFWLDWMKYLSFLHYTFRSLMWFLYLFYYRWSVYKNFTALARLDEISLIPSLYIPFPHAIGIHQCTSITVSIYHFPPFMTLSSTFSLLHMLLDRLYCNTNNMDLDRTGTFRAV